MIDPRNDALALITESMTTAVRSEVTTYRVLGHPPDLPLQVEGFHRNIVRCEPGKAAPLHYDLTQEGFVALSDAGTCSGGLAVKRQDVVS